MPLTPKGPGGRTGVRVRSQAGYAERLFAALLSAAVGLTLAGVVFNAGIRPMPEAAVVGRQPEFNGRAALLRTTEFVKTFPTRSAGEPEKTRAAQWIVDQLVVLGYDPQVQTFSAWIGGVRYSDLANVWAVRRGMSTETIAVYGHYDLPPFVEEGAADAGSSVGALLELAGRFSDEVPERSVLFLFLDASEYGKAGARAFLAGQPYADPIVAGVGLDFLNVGRMAGLSVEFTGTQKGYTPPWLRSLSVAAGAAADPQGEVFAVDAASEWAERSVAVSPTDTGIFLRSGIPAVNLAGVPVDTALERSVYHSEADVAANLDATAMQAWGRAAELVVRSVSALPSVPGGAEGSMVHLGLAGNRYVAPWAVRLAQLLIFSPLLGVCALGWVRRRRASRSALRILLGEARRILAVAAVPAAAFVVLKLAPAVGLLARYHLYPATEKDPALYQPQFIPLALATAAAFGAAYLLRRYTRWLEPPMAADWSERYHALTTLLALLVLATWVEGAAYAAVTFLALPAALWLFLAEPPVRRGWLERGVGGALVLSGTAMFVAFLVLFNRFYLSGPAWWFSVLASVHGLFSLKSVLVFLGAAALHWESFALATGLGAGTMLPSDLPYEPGRPWGRPVSPRVPY